MAKKKPAKVDDVPPKIEYVTVHAIKEDTVFYKPGSDYLGERVDKFLKDGQIKLKV